MTWSSWIRWHLSKFKPQNCFEGVRTAESFPASCCPVTGFRCCHWHKMATWCIAVSLLHFWEEVIAYVHSTPHKCRKLSSYLNRVTWTDKTSCGTTTAPDWWIMHQRHDCLPLEEGPLTGPQEQPKKEGVINNKIIITIIKVHAANSFKQT